MRRTLRILLLLLCFVFFGIFCFAGYKLYATLHDYKAAETMYEDLNQQFVAPTQEDQKTGPEPSPDPQVFPEHEAPEVKAGDITVDFDALLALNPNVIGWIYSPNTMISYPVVQGYDNDYYLHRFLDGTENPSGTIFMDYLCNADFSLHNSVIYGHHMNDGSMFAELSNYKQEGYYKQHPYMYYYTPDKAYLLLIVNGFVTSAEDEVYTFSFPDDDSYAAYLDRMHARSYFDSPVTVEREDHIVTLSTCSYEFDDARFVIQAKIVPIS
jgi:sortase B